LDHFGVMSVSPTTRLQRASRMETPMIRRAIAWSLLALSTLGGLLSVYWLLFALWMSAHPLYDSHAWHVRVYERFAFTIADGLVWVGAIVWLWRIAKTHQTSDRRQSDLGHIFRRQPRCILLPMNRFGTARDAKEYLIRRILDEADREGVPLSHLERNMLSFSVTDWTQPGMADISRDFDQHYDQGEYERKIGRIIRRILDQPDSNRDEWNEAVRRLREEDHYILVLIDCALRAPVKLTRWEIIKLILAGAVVVGVFLPIVFFIHSRVANPSVAKWIDQGTLLALVVLVTFLANRGHRKSA
jgi:hypothetical protein